MSFLKRQSPKISEADLDAATLRTFGRRRRTAQFIAHLARAKELINGRRVMPWDDHGKESHLVFDA